MSLLTIEFIGEDVVDPHDQIGVDEANEVEKRLIMNESTIYGIQQYIEAKGAESNYHEQMQQSIVLSQQINDEIIRRSLAP